MDHMLQGGSHVLLQGAGPCIIFNQGKDAQATSAGFKVAEHFGVQNLERPLPRCPHPK